MQCWPFFFTYGRPVNTSSQANIGNHCNRLKKKPTSNWEVDQGVCPLSCPPVIDMGKDCAHHQKAERASKASHYPWFINPSIPHLLRKVNIHLGKETQTRVSWLVYVYTQNERREALKKKKHWGIKKMRRVRERILLKINPQKKPRLILMWQDQPSNIMCTHTHTQGQPRYLQILYLQILLLGKMNSNP